MEKVFSLGGLLRITQCSRVTGCSENPRIYLAKSLSISETNGELPDSAERSSETQVRESEE